jgi:MraZ protein
MQLETQFTGKKGKMMFFGKYTLQLSETNHLILPSGFREEMSSPAYITQGFDRNLLLLSRQAFNAFYSHLKETSISDPLARLMSRLFLGGAVEIVGDHSGKVELPVSLCDYAGLSREIILVGQGDYLELWSPALWQEQLNALNDYGENAHRFERFHISLT